LCLIKALVARAGWLLLNANMSSQSDVSKVQVWLLGIAAGKSAKHTTKLRRVRLLNSSVKVESRIIDWFDLLRVGRTYE